MKATVSEDEGDDDDNDESFGRDEGSFSESELVADDDSDDDDASTRGESEAGEEEREIDSADYASAEGRDSRSAQRLNADEAEVIEMDRRLARADASLDTPVKDGEARSTTRLELLPSMGESPDSVAENAELEELLKVQLDEFRKTLSGKDVAIFDKRLVADEPLTLQELGDEFGVSRERVRQLEARLTGKLRDYLKKTLGDAVGVG